jgi:hypothetical protein
MSLVLFSPDDYTLSADGRTIFLAQAPNDYQELLAQYELPDAENRGGDLHNHVTERKTRWNEDTQEASWLLSEEYVPDSLQVFKGEGCGVPHEHRTDNFTGTGAQTAFTLSYEPMRNPLITVAGVVQRLTTNYSRTGAVVTFASAPANGAAIVVTYISEGTVQAVPPHMHYYESKSTWGGGNIWTLRHGADKNVQALYKVHAGVVTTLVYLTDFWMVDDKVYVIPTPVDGDVYLLYYSYCVGGVLPGDTIFVDSDEDIPPLPGMPSGSVVEYQGQSYPYSGVGNVPFTAPSSAYGDTGATVNVTYPDGSHHTITLIVLSMYLHDSADNKLYKVINGKTPVPLTHPTLIGPTAVVCGPSKLVAWACDTGVQTGANQVLYSTANGGSTWQTRTIASAGANHAVGVGCVHPTDPLTFWVPVYRPVPGPDAGCGFYVTHDGGVTWALKLAVTGFMPAAVRASALFPVGIPCHASISCSDDGTVMLAALQDDQVPAAWKLYRSTDSGETWTEVVAEAASGVYGTHFFPPNFGSPLTPARTTAISMGSSSTGNVVRHSTDLGATWDAGETFFGGWGLVYPDCLFINGVSTAGIYIMRVSRNGVTPDMESVTISQGLAFGTITDQTALDSIMHAVSKQQSKIAGFIQDVSHNIYWSHDAATYTLYQLAGAHTWQTIGVI